MAIENAARYGIRVVDGEEFPTYANVNAVVKKPIKDTISGSDNLDTENFKYNKQLQKMILLNHYLQYLMDIQKQEFMYGLKDKI